MTIETNGSSTRIDGAFSIGMRRFYSTSGDSIWRVEITRDPGTKPILAGGDLTLIGLVELERWVKDAKNALETDGGRRAIATDKNKEADNG